MTYDDVADIKAMLVTIVALLDEQIRDAQLRIEDDVSDVATALTPEDGA